MNALVQNTKITVSDINNLISELNGKLNLSGGTINGNLIVQSLQFVNGGVISSSNDEMYKSFTLTGGNTWSDTNPFIIMRKIDATSSDKGCITINAGDGTTYSRLTLSPKGYLQWNGKNVITSDGGTLTGYIKHNVGDILSNVNDNQWTSIKGGSGHNKGAAVTLYGQDYNDGVAELIAHKEGVGTQKISIHPSNGVTTGKIHTDELEIKYSKLYFQGDADTFITRNWDTTNGYYYLVMQAGTWGSGGRVELYDNESPHEAGAVALIAADKCFIVYPNGIARHNGELQANYLYLHPQNNDREGGELKLAAANSNFHHVICDNYNDTFRVLFQNSSGSVPYIYNFNKNGRIDTPTGSFWIA